MDVLRSVLSSSDRTWEQLRRRLAGLVTHHGAEIALLRDLWRRTGCAGGPPRRVAGTSEGV